MKTITAYCWATGLIEFTTRAQRVVPAGAIPIASGPPRRIKDVIEALGRKGMGESEGFYLVPGVPEAELMKSDPLDALKDFAKRVKGALQN